MIAKLSDDIASELERNGDRPLAVENPRTNKLYVLLPMDRYGRPVETPVEGRPNDAWDESKNARRVELIRRDVLGQLANWEIEELKELQAEIDAHLERVAPLPWKALQEIHSELLKKALAGGDRT